MKLVNISIQRKYDRNKSRMIYTVSVFVQDFLSRADGLHEYFLVESLCSGYQRLRTQDEISKEQPTLDWQIVEFDDPSLAVVTVEDVYEYCYREQMCFHELVQLRKW